MARILAAVVNKLCIVNNFIHIDVDCPGKQLITLLLRRAPGPRTTVLYYTTSILSMNSTSTDLQVTYKCILI